MIIRGCILVLLFAQVSCDKSSKISGSDGGNRPGDSVERPEPNEPKSTPRPEKEIRTPQNRESEKPKAPIREVPHDPEFPPEADMTPRPNPISPIIPQGINPDSPPKLPQTPELPQLPPEAEPTTVSLQVPVTMLANMASGNQITNPDNVARLMGSDGRTIAVGRMSPRAVLDGAPVEVAGSRRAAFVLKIKLDQVASGLAPGKANGHLTINRGSIGPRGDVAFTSVTNLHADTLPNHYDYDVSYEVGGDGDIRILGVSGYRLNEGAAEAPLVATLHPVMAFAAGDNMRTDFNSPIVLDLDDNGKVDLISAFSAQAVSFDLTGEGAKKTIGWVSPEDGILALDRNGDGVINDGTELFGEHFSGKSSYRNGFYALAQFDGNRDGQINGYDPIYPKLMVWRDLNGDGVSSEGELSSLAGLRISSISLRFKGVKPDKQNVADNDVRLHGNFVRDGQTRMLADVWFRTRTLPSIAHLFNSQKGVK